MMISFIFTKKAQALLLHLPDDAQKRITQKLIILKKHDDIFSVVGKLTGLEPSTHRIRIGSYRLLVSLHSQTKDNTEFLVLKVGHRKDIYK